MKKILLIFLISGTLSFLLMSIILMGLTGGEGGAAVQIVATEEEAYVYQYVGTELGVPWDIVLLSDAIRADAEGHDNVSAYNPLYTSLEFCILAEEILVAEKTEVTKPEETEDSEENESEENETEENESEEETEPETEYIITWHEEGVTNYSGRKEILSYLGWSMENLSYQDATKVVVRSQEAAEEKSIEDEIQYRVTLIINPDFEEVLKERIGLKEKDIGRVMDLYDCGYMAALYGYTFDYGDIQLPGIIIGNVSRAELAQVAVSIIGHPYLMGGKSSEEGAPKGPLDCSGYVDWVYYQCFGTTVSTGSIPNGVAVSGTGLQWYATESVKEKELKVGDLGFMSDPAAMKAGQINHVGIYLGEYAGSKLWIHCGGSFYGTPDLPKGRVGISKLTGSNNYDPVSGTEFSPAMKGCRFKYFRRPRFEFRG